MFFHQKSLFSLFCSAMTLRVASFHFFQKCHCCSQSESERNTKNIYIYISWLIAINIKWIHILYLQKMFHKTNKIRHQNRKQILLACENSRFTLILAYIVNLVVMGFQM